VFIKNLPTDIKGEDLFKSFNAISTVISCKVLYNKENSDSRGSAIINFASAEAVEAAITGMQGHKFKEGDSGI